MDPDRDTRGPLMVARGERVPNDRNKPRVNGRRRGYPNDRPRTHGNRSRNDYMSNNGPQMRILTKQNDRTTMVKPGTVSIMQRESSTSGGSETPASPHLHSPETMPIPQINHHVTHPRQPPHRHQQQPSHDIDIVKRPARRNDHALGSTPSNYTPLQPSARSTRAERERDTTGGFSRVDSGTFMAPLNDTFSMKLIDKNLHFQEKGKENLMDQSDFLVVGCLGKQGAGKSTVMSLLAGTRTGSGRAYLFRTQSKEIQDTNGYQTVGVDMVVTSERIILLDSQPILSDALLDHHIAEAMLPSGMTPETYLDILSLQTAIFMFTVCHVVMVVLESTDLDVIFRFLWIAEKLKSTCCRVPYDDMSDGPAQEYFPQIVFVLNHATPDDFQPSALKELHSLFAENLTARKLLVAGNVSLACSGLIPVGKLIPPDKKGAGPVVGPANVGKGCEVRESDVNLHLLPTNTNSQDNYGAHCVERRGREDAGLNPVLSLLPMYRGHPSFHLLAETLRNQILMIHRSNLRPSRQQPMFEKDWYDYAHRTWLSIRKSDIITEHQRLLEDLRS